MRIGCQIGMWKGDVPFEQKLAAIGATDAGGVEVFVEHLLPYYDDPGALAALLDGADLALSGAYFNSKEFLDPAAEDKVVAEAAAAMKCLRAVGGQFLLLNGGLWKGDAPRTFNDEEFARLARVFNRIGDEGAAIGVGVVTHPHWKCQVETPADVDRLVGAGLDWCRAGLCVHASHQYLIDADPYAIYEKHAAHVRYVHLGDSDGAKKGTFLGKGALDQNRLMQPLLDAGYDGWLILECGKEGTTPAVYTARAIAYLHNTWPQVPWED